MKEGYPEHYEILPEPLERTLDVAKRLLRFLFLPPTVHPYMSEHYRPRGAAEMLDAQLYEQGRLDV